METTALDTLELLVDAIYSRDKRDLLRRINLRIERLRYVTRLAKNLRLLSVSHYEFADRAILDTGTEIDGWSKHR